MSPNLSPNLNPVRISCAEDADAAATPAIRLAVDNSPPLAPNTVACSHQVRLVE